VSATAPRSIRATVNGRAVEVPVAPWHTLLDALRDTIGLTGTKECCLVGECGACTVLLDGRSVDSCLVLAAEADGATITTVEGLAGPGGRLSALQRAFLDTGAAQCGFCIPGQLVSAEALLALVPHPTRTEIEEGIAGNLCRCAGYEQIIEAIQRAAEAADADDAAEAAEAADAGSASSGSARHRPTEPSVDVALVPDASVAPQ
jgi:carbon-monoxide dehydrogenase small subunit